MNEIYFQSKHCYFAGENLLLKHIRMLLTFFSESFQLDFTTYLFLYLYSSRVHKQFYKTSIFCIDNHLLAITAMFITTRHKR